VYNITFFSIFILGQGPICKFLVRLLHEECMQMLYKLQQ